MAAPRRVSGWLAAVVTGVSVACGQPAGQPVAVSHRGDAGMPAPRTAASAVYDAADGTVVMFGGSDRTGTLRETWTWDGSSWRRQHPTVSPPAREFALMAYDPALRQVVLFGGETCPPPARNDLIGCGKDYVTLADTWTWDGHTWTDLHTAHAPDVPLPGVTSAGADADIARGRLTLVTAGKPDPDFLVQTWILANGDWQRLHPRHSPPAYDFAGPAFDSSGGRLILQQQAPPHYMCNQSGCPNRPALLYDTTWSWDGSDWRDLGLAARAPHDYGQLISTGRSGVFMIGGSGQYLWNGSTWNPGQELPPSIFGNNAQRIEWTAAYHEPTRRVVLTGGRAFETNHLYADTVGWDGASWKTLVPAPPTPGPRQLPPCSPSEAYSLMDGTGSGGVYIEFAEPPAGPCHLHVNVVVTLGDAAGAIAHVENNPATQPVDGDLTFDGGGQAVFFVFEHVCWPDVMTWTLQAGDLRVTGTTRSATCSSAGRARITSSVNATPSEA
jgi:hypothetical protein